MRKRVLITFSCYAALLTAATFSTPVQCGSPPVVAKDEVRHFKFPTEYPLGALRLVGDLQHPDDDRGTNIGPALGAKTVKIPAGQCILLDLNPHCLEHPERLKNMPTDGISRLQMSYLSMDDNDHSICDVALKALPEFKDLISLNIESSDTTDSGLAEFKSLSHIRYLFAFGSALNGSILKSPEKLQQLMSVNFKFNPIKAENLKYLSALPQIRELFLERTNITDDDLKPLEKCTKLKKLGLTRNAKITDKSTAVLRKLTALEVLKLRETSLTTAGILTLKGLKLTDLEVPEKKYSAEEKSALSKAFPKAKIVYEGFGVAKDTQIILAPMK